MSYVFLVDADDTILDFHGVSEEALCASFAEVGLAWKEEYLSTYKKVNAGLWEMLERREISRTALMNERFPRYLKTLGITEVSGEDMNAVYIRYLSTKPKYFSGAQEFLAELRKLGKIYVVTNGTKAIQESRFKILNLQAEVEDIFISETAGFDKPAKGYTDYVIANIDDFVAEKAVWIGDSLSADIKAANDAGICSIWFNPRRQSRTGEIVPDYEVTSFNEILEILKRIVDK